MRAICVAASLAGLASAEMRAPDYLALWDRFKSDYGKTYDTNGGEEEKRFEAFKANVDVIEATNAKNLSHKLGVNQFADLTGAEFATAYLGGYKPELRLGGVQGLQKEAFPNITGLQVPDAVDWVASGAVTAVKNQRSCGSCWAFSSTGAIEGAYYVASKQLISLSEEDLVQCDQTDQGCNGGIMESAFSFVKEHGICSEEDYPYTSGGGTRGTCHRGCSPVVTLTGYVDVPASNEVALQAALAKQPVSIAIEADKTAFQLYQHGILDNPACGTKLDHGVLLVGYGTDGGKDYWKVKNSWGPAWGEEGYIRMVRGAGGAGQCGLAAQPTYPTGVTAADPGPAPGPSPTPGPAPPSPSGETHYGDPNLGCEDDEEAVEIDGVEGQVCAPSCRASPCPTDVPEGTTVAPKCALQNPTGTVKLCALVCDPFSFKDQCGPATCAMNTEQPSVGICAYAKFKDSHKPKFLLGVPKPADIVV